MRAFDFSDLGEPVACSTAFFRCFASACLFCQHFCASILRALNLLLSFIFFFRLFLTIFAHGCDVTSMSLVGSPIALTHSILINLFIKAELNTFSPTSPA